jgi:hypothetical protein
MQDSKDLICCSILQSGKRKGTACGRKNCGYHKKKDDIINEQKNQPEEKTSVEIPQQFYDNCYFCRFPPEILSIIFSFHFPTLIEFSKTNKTHKYIAFKQEVFYDALPRYIRINISFSSHIPIFNLWTNWENTKRLCSNLLCPISLQQSDTCDDCCNKICKTTAIKTYGLNPIDLQNINRDEVRNPYYRSAPPMLLFSERDIRIKALEKYGGWNELDEKFEVRNKISEKRKETRKKKEKEFEESENKRLEVFKKMTSQQREECLMTAMNKYGLVRREDSQLIPAFIKWTTKITVDNVIALLLMTRDWFGNYSDSESDSDDNYYNSDIDRDDRDYRDYRYRPSFEDHSDSMKKLMYNYMVSHPKSNWIEAYYNIKA